MAKAYGRGGKPMKATETREEGGTREAGGTHVPTPKKAVKARRATVATKDSAAWNRFYRQATQAYLGYLNRITAGEANIRRRVQEAYSKYTHGMNMASKDLQDRLAAANRAYAESLAAAWGPSEAAERCENDFKNYASVMQEVASPSGEHQAQVERSFHAMLSDLEAAVDSDDAETRSRNAFNQYIAQLQDVLGKSALYEHAAKRARSYMDSLREVQDQGAARTSDAYKQYLGSLQGAWEGADLVKGLEAAYTRYTEDLGAVWEQFSDLYEDATKEATDRLRVAWSAVSPGRTER
jgi:hypothetical protein